MTTPDHLRITGPEDILGFIPHSLGYWPANSLVAMTVQGNRLGATLRVDLPAPSRCRGQALAAFARTVRGYLKADDAADGSLLAIFGKPPRGGGRGHGPEGGPASAHPAVRVPDPPAVDRLLAKLELTLDEAGLPVRDAWIVGERYWRNAHCVDPSCCPLPGRPVEEITNSRLNAELVYRGSSVGAAPGTPAPRGLKDQCRPAALEAEARWAREFAGRWRVRAQFDDVLDVWERVLHAAAPGSDAPRAGAGATEPDPPGPDAPGFPSPGAGALADGLSGYLRATLCVAAWRDGVLVMAAAGRRAALAGAEEFGMFDGGGHAAPLPELDGLPLVPAPAPVPAAPTVPVPAERSGRLAAADSEADARTAANTAADSAVDTGTADGAAADTAAAPGYGDVLLGLEPPAPDWALLAGLDRILLRLNDCGGGEARAAGLTARGWIEWCRGRGSYADALFTAAAEEQPGYRLAELLGELVRRGTLCGWAGRRDSAWQKFDPDAA
ncbi:DUF4192 family protein [Arthrobacter sp. B3I4]|uniref:DUF4192 family protein n=1 Tax=Arthrobacter sp. B3I4 TaxID=3042267 RepID=UPI002784A946|nr:DUF4192 family protein [Arthrobacter sp. B3I4]MDQ0756753.1 hypothetical protein [Arthrobacter sp. B3I4]